MTTSAARRALRMRGAVAAALLLPSVTGCYTYGPVAGERAAIGAPVDLSITDNGRVGLTPALGPGILGLRGALLERTDSSFVLSVREVRAIGAGATQWMGDTVRIRRDYVGAVEQRRFSRGRTAVVVGALTAAIVLIAHRSLIGTGGSGGGSRLPPDQGGGT